MYLLTVGYSRMEYLFFTWVLLNWLINRKNYQQLTNQQLHYKYRFTLSKAVTHRQIICVYTYLGYSQMEYLLSEWCILGCFIEKKPDQQTNSNFIDIDNESKSEIVIKPDVRCYCISI